MNQPRKRPAPRRQSSSKPSPPVDIWRTTAPLPDVEPIRTPDEVGALLRSLGEPRIAGADAAAGYFTAVLERAAAVAAALAFSADLLTDPESG